MLVRVQPELPNFMITFCKDCMFYQQEIPEDVCLNEAFVSLDFITGKKIYETCKEIRYEKNPWKSECPRFVKLAKGH